LALLFPVSRELVDLSGKGSFVQILTFLEYLRIAIAGFGAAAAGDITGNVNILALFFA